MLALTAIAGLVGATAGSAVGTGAPGGLTWSSLSPPTNPPGLVGAVATYDSADGTVVLFGGRLADGQLSDQTWVWNGSDWSEPTLYGSIPAPRQLASMTFDADLDPPEVVLFGGRGADGALLDDTWVWNGSSWNQIPATSSPGAREGAAMATDSDHHLVLFGGYGISTPARTTPPTPPTTTTTTTAPPTTTTTTTLPPATTTTTTGTGAGGVPGSGASPTAAGAVPGPGQKDSHSTAGAPTASSANRTSALPEVLDDTWTLSQTDNGADQWQRVTTAVHPPATTDAALAAGPSGANLLFGGTSREPGDDQSGGASARSWVWTGHVWSSVRTRVGPSARQDTSLVYDADLGATVLYGGLARGGPMADTWLWDGRSWQQAEPATAPSARSGAATAYDAGTRQLLVFGGLSASGSTLSSTEVLSTQAPTRVTPTPPARTTPTTVRSGSTSSTVGTTTRTEPTSQAHHPGSSSTGPTVSSPTTARPSIVEHRGDIVTLTGSGFLPDAVITITFHSVAVTVGTRRANAQGVFRINVVVPVQAAIGEHHFEASGMGPDGLIDLITPVSVVALGASHHTPTSTKLTLIAIALAIPAASWLAIEAAGRRRRRRAAPA